MPCCTYQRRYKSHFRATSETLRKGTVIDFGTDLTDVIVYLGEAAIDTTEKREKEYKSHMDTVAVVHYKVERSPNDQMDRHKKIETFYGNQRDKAGEKTSTSVQSTLNAVREYCTRWPSFKIYAKDIFAKLM